TSQPSSSSLHATLEKMNTLADVLVGCVNSSGPSESGCTDLFAASLGPSDTLRAALHIAARPGVNAKGEAIFALLPPSTIFQPVLDAAPEDWTIAGQRFAFGFNGGTDNSVRTYAIGERTGALSRTSTFSLPLS